MVESEDYLRIAQAWAEDRGRRHALKTELPARLPHSPLGDAMQLARNIEEAYRKMWAVQFAPDTNRPLDLDFSARRPGDKRRPRYSPEA